MAPSLFPTSLITLLSILLLITLLPSPANGNPNKNTNPTLGNTAVRRARFVHAMRTATHGVPLGRHKHKHKRTHTHKRKQMLRAMLSRATFHPPSSPRQLEDADEQADDAVDDAAGNDDAAADDQNVDDYYYQQQQEQQQRDDDMYLNYGFDLSEYSLKYAGCSSVATFSDEMAQDEESDTVFMTNQFVVFRFCPTQTCSGTSVYGCMQDYGEYMLPIDQWLEIIAEYREEEYERYCDYCADCQEEQEYYQDQDQDQEEDQQEEEENEDEGEDQRARRLADQNQDAQDDIYGEDQPYANGYCSLCNSYADLCNDDEEHQDWSGFFDCVEFDVDDDTVLYIGPHCASDKSKIVLTMFSDEYCSNYVGDQYDVNTITGLDLTDETLMQYYNNDCIACKESDLMFQDADQDEDENENENENGIDITEVCENMYEQAAKCNKYMVDATQQSYQSSEQYDNQNTVCSFIKSVVTGAYNEKGYIYYDAAAYTSDNLYNEFASDLYRVEIITTGQMLGLFAFSALLVIFLVSACIMHGQIQKKNTSGIGVGTMSTRNLNINGKDKKLLGSPRDIPRQNSGIMACRSEATQGSNVSGGDVTAVAPYMGGSYGKGTMA